MLIMKKINKRLVVAMLLVSFIFTQFSFVAFSESEPVIKNVIYMIPDGGGFALFDFANAVKKAGGFNNDLYPNATKLTNNSMYLKDYLIGTETTRSNNSSVTDSAAGGKASEKYKEPLSNIKRWAKRYDGTWESLKDKSRRPHSHPNQHTLYIFEEHTPENSVKFLNMLTKKFHFEILSIQTDNGTEFTYKFISDKEKCPFEDKLTELGIEHKLIKPRTPWHNGKVERSHRMDQRYFYEWETFRSIEEANEKSAKHLKWTNNKPMRIFKGKSPMQKLMDYIWVI